MSLERKAVLGAAWTIATGLGTRVLGVVGSVALTHFIDPGVVGEVENASVLVVTAAYFSNIGMAQYVIAHPGVGRAATFHATLLMNGLGLLALAAAVALGGPLAPLLKAPAMTRYVLPMALAMLIERVGFMPSTILVREMRFRALGIIRSLGEISYTVSSVALAVVGFGGMAIVWGNLLRYGLTTLLFVATVPWREWLEPSRLRRDTARELLAYGAPLWAGSITGFGSRRWDNSLVSALFGPATAGLYKQAYNLADIPASQVGEQIGDVLMPSFVQMHPAGRPRALLRSTALLALIVTPMAIGLGAVAHTLTRAVLSEKWSGVAPMLLVLSVLSVVRPIGWTVGAYLQALKRTRTVMFLEVFKLVVLLASIATVGRLGPLVVCAMVGVAFAAHAVLGLASVGRDGVQLRRFLIALARPLVACIPMVAAVLAVRYGLRAAGVTGRVVPLVAEIVAGAGAYVPAALVFARETSQDLLGLIRRALRGERDAAAA